MDNARSTTDSQDSQPLVGGSTVATPQVRPYGREDWNEQERAAVALAQAAVASQFGSAPVWQSGTLAVMEALLAQMPGQNGADIELVAREAGMSVDGQLMPLLSHLCERFPELVTRELVAPDGQVIAPWNLNKMIAQQPDPNWVETVVLRWSPGPGIRQMQSERAAQLQDQERTAVELVQLAVEKAFGPGLQWRAATAALMEVLLAGRSLEEGPELEALAKKFGVSANDDLSALLSFISKDWLNLVKEEIVAPDGQVISSSQTRKLSDAHLDSLVLRWSAGPGLQPHLIARALQSQDTQEPANDEADEAAYFVAENWDDLGRTVRFVFDTKANALAAAQSRGEGPDGQPQWHALSWQRQRELEQSVKDNLGMSEPQDMGLSECNEPPAWAASLIEQQAQPEIVRPRQRP